MTELKRQLELLKAFVKQSALDMSDTFTRDERHNASGAVTFIEEIFSELKEHADDIEDQANSLKDQLDDVIYNVEEAEEKCRDAKDEAEATKSNADDLVNSAEDFSLELENIV